MSPSKLDVFATWHHALAVASLLLGAACSLLLSVQGTRHPQHMSMMKVV